MAEQRTAYTALGALKQPAADAILAAELKKLATGQIPLGAQVELLDAAALRSSPEVKKFTWPIVTPRSAKDSDPLAAFRVALEGGNAKKGRSLFYYHPRPPRLRALPQCRFRWR